MTEVSIRFWSDARVAEEARLESVYTPKGYPEFESRSLRKIEALIINVIVSVFSFPDMAACL